MNQCRCGATLMPTVTVCPRCGARQGTVGARAVPGPRIAAGVGAGAGVDRGPAPRTGGRPSGTGALRSAPPRGYRPLPEPPAGLPYDYSTIVGPLLPTGRGQQIGSWIAGTLGMALVTAAMATGLAALPTTWDAVVSPPGTSTAASPAPAGVSSPAAGPSASVGSSAPTGRTAGAIAPGAGTATASDADITDALADQARTDRDDVAALAGQWVPRLAATRAGTRADGIVYDDAAVLSDHEALRARYPQARLLWSGDRSQPVGEGLWVTVADEPFTTASEADAWCVEQGLSDRCTATQL